MVNAYEKHPRPRFTGNAARARIVAYMEGRASRAELISEAIIIELTPGPTGDVWSLDVDYPVGVTRGVWDIIQRAVTAQGASDKPGSVIKDMVYMADLCI